MEWLTEQQKCGTIPLLSAGAGFMTGVIPIVGVSRFASAGGAGIAAELAVRSYEDVTFERMVAVGGAGVLGAVVAYFVLPK